MSHARNNPAIVIDNGTGFTKVGFAGSTQPQDIFQTAISRRHRDGKILSTLEDLDFVTGGGQPISSHKSYFPIKHGIVENWDDMERLWQRCIYEKLRCDPEDHYFLLTETPLNTPENRELTAEIMFETFNVPGIHIAVQAVLALTASWTDDNRDLSGVVVDSGDGSTQIVPVVDGHVMSNCIQQIEIGGRDVTYFVQDIMRERKEEIPKDCSAEIAKIVKEQYSYTCPNIEKELARYDSNPEKYIRKYEGIRKVTGQKWTCNIGYERFLCPEIIFNPEIYDSTIKSKLSDVVDEAILKCPIDSRRKLYENIVLSGGNTLFKDFARRLQRDVKKRVEMRLQSNRDNEGKLPNSFSVQNVNVNVIENQAENYSVWLGGSILASTDNFFDICHTRAQYEEEGPRIARHNITFKADF